MDRGHIVRRLKAVQIVKEMRQNRIKEEKEERKDEVLNTCLELNVSSPINSLQS